MIGIFGALSIAAFVYAFLAYRYSKRVFQELQSRHYKVVSILDPEGNITIVQEYGTDLQRSAVREPGSAS